MRMLSGLLVLGLAVLGSSVSRAAEEPAVQQVTAAVEGLR